MAKKDLFDSIDVPEPCPQSWEAMVGDDKARFCASCEKDIYNLSEMTRREAKKLVLQSKRSVCVRMEKDADGKLKTLKKQFHQITRRASVAAGVLSASLTLSAVASAQKIPPPRIGKAAIPQSVKGEKSTASISGTITDTQGAVIPNAQVVLLDAKGKTVQKTISNDDGFYELKNIKAGVYNLMVEEQFFKEFIQRKLEIKGDEKKNLPIKLEVEKSSIIMGVLGFSEPPEIPESDEPKITDKIQTRRIESLPVSNRQKKN